jgi:hypothetical protein
MIRAALRIRPGSTAQTSPACSGGVGLDHQSQGVEADRVDVDPLVVDGTICDQFAQDGVQHGDIGAATDRQVDVGVFRGLGQARIDDDEPRGVRAA